MQKTLRKFVWATLALSLFTQAAWAEVDVKAADVRVPANPASDQLIDVEVYLSNVTPDFTTPVAGWTVVLNIVGGAGHVQLSPFRPSPLQLTPTEHPYFFAAASADAESARPTIPDYSEAYSSSEIIASGLADVGRDQTISTGQGMLRLQMLIHAGTEGVFPLTLTPDLTTLADRDGAAVSGLKLIDGSITVGVPEPSMEIALSSMIVIAMRRPQRRRALNYLSW